MRPAEKPKPSRACNRSITTIAMPVSNAWPDADRIADEIRRALSLSQTDRPIPLPGMGSVEHADRLLSVNVMLAALGGEENIDQIDIRGNRLCVRLRVPNYLQKEKMALPEIRAIVQVKDDRFHIICNPQMRWSMERTSLTPSRQSGFRPS